jgi:hypothetical protein
MNRRPDDTMEGAPEKGFPQKSGETETSGHAEFKPAGKGGDDAITRNLKRVYEDIAAEPLPENLLKLLERLDKVDNKNG